MVSVPDCGPTEVGMNRTVTCMEAPGATTRNGGKTVNTPLEIVRLVTFKAAFPVLDMVRGSAAELPVVTEPKFSDVGETPMSGAGGAVPVPDIETVMDVCVASLLAMVRVPD